MENPISQLTLYLRKFPVLAKHRARLGQAIRSHLPGLEPAACTDGGVEPTMDEKLMKMWVSSVRTLEVQKKKNMDNHGDIYNLHAKHDSLQRKINGDIMGSPSQIRSFLGVSIGGNGFTKRHWGSWEHNGHILGLYIFPRDFH